MSRIRVFCQSMSADGFTAGPDQTLDNPLGVGGEMLHGWVFVTETGRKMFGKPGGTVGIDNEILATGAEGFGATIMGRKMFGPIRGEWGDSDWSGWWGDTPPYGHDTFVLTHYPHPPIELNGTTFYFVSSAEEALERARESAGEKDIRISGGASTIRQYLAAGLVDELQIAFVPILLGSGERIFEGIDLSKTYECTKVVPSEKVTHLTFTRKA